MTLNWKGKITKILVLFMMDMCLQCACQAKDRDLDQKTYFHPCRRRKGWRCLCQQWWQDATMETTQTVHSRWPRGVCREHTCSQVDLHTLPEGHEQVGKLARLCRSMYGTRDAASIWRGHMVRCVEREFHEGRICMHRFLLQSRWRSQRIVSWWRLLCGCTTEAVANLWKGPWETVWGEANQPHWSWCKRQEGAEDLESSNRNRCAERRDDVGGWHGTW